VTWVESVWFRFNLSIGLGHNIQGLGYKGEVIGYTDEGLWV